MFTLANFFLQYSQYTPSGDPGEEGFSADEVEGGVRAGVEGVEVALVGVVGAAGDLEA